MLSNGWNWRIVYLSVCWKTCQYMTIAIFAKNRRFLFNRNIKPPIHSLNTIIRYIFLEKPLPFQHLCASTFFASLSHSSWKTKYSHNEKFSFHESRCNINAHIRRLNVEMLRGNIFIIVLTPRFIILFCNNYFAHATVWRKWHSFRRLLPKHLDTDRHTNNVWLPDVYS